MPRYYEGATWVITATFTDPLDDDELVDPDEVVITVEAPDGTESTPDVENPSVGVYQADVVLNQPGFWDAIVQGTGDAHNATRPHRIEAHGLPFNPND